MVSICVLHIHNEKTETIIHKYERDAISQRPIHMNFVVSLMMDLSVLSHRRVITPTPHPPSPPASIKAYQLLHQYISYIRVYIDLYIKFIHTCKNVHHLTYSNN